jgi:hypothetical protein
MGLQQALGLLISELFESLFLEIKDSYMNGFTKGVDQNSFLSALRIRAIRIIDNLLIKWKNIAIAFRDGSISGILSNILTTFINTFLTTTKRLIRIIREGFFGILQATKLIFLRPKGMSASEAADAALKLLTATVFTGIGIIAEESLAKFIGTIPYSDIIIPALIGGLVGISSSIVVYMLDKLDLFGVHEKESHQLTISQLQREIYSIDLNINTIYDDAMHTF